MSFGQHHPVIEVENHVCVQFRRGNREGFGPHGAVLCCNRPDTQCTDIFAAGCRAIEDTARCIDGITRKQRRDVAAGIDGTDLERIAEPVE